LRLSAVVIPPQTPISSRAMANSKHSTRTGQRKQYDLPSFTRLRIDSSKNNDDEAPRQNACAYHRGVRQTKTLSSFDQLSIRS